MDGLEEVVSLDDFTAVDSQEMVESPVKEERRLCYRRRKEARVVERQTLRMKC